MKKTALLIFFSLFLESSYSHGKVEPIFSIPKNVNKLSPLPCKTKIIQLIKKFDKENCIIKVAMFSIDDEMILGKLNTSKAKVKVVIDKGQLESSINRAGVQKKNLLKYAKLVGTSKSDLTEEEKFIPFVSLHEKFAVFACSKKESLVEEDKFKSDPGISETTENPPPPLVDTKPEMKEDQDLRRKIVKKDFMSSPSSIEKPFSPIIPEAEIPVVIVGSFNWTKAASESNYENCLVIDDPEVVNAFDVHFDNDLYPKD